MTDTNYLQSKNSIMGFTQTCMHLKTSNAPENMA